MKRFIREAKGGYYTPAFLTLNIDSPENFELLMSDNGLSERTEALFLHEYVHLLQDIITVSGLVNIAIVVDYMKWATNITKSGQLQVPCIPKIEDGYNLYPNAELGKIMIGDAYIKDGYNNHVSWKETINVELISGGTILNGQRIESQIVLELTIIASNNNEYKYKVGEHCISETMAYLIENHIYNNAIESPTDFPYRAVLYVCDFYIDGFSDDPLNVIALCDACLMHSFPGMALYYSLQELTKYPDLTPKQIYDICTSRKILELTGVTKGCSIEILFERRIREAMSQMTGYFTANYDNMVKWIKQMFEAALKLRIENPHIMIDIASSGKIRNNYPLIYVLNEIGCPVIMNSLNNMVYIVNDNIDYDVYPPVFNVIYQIYSILRNRILQHNTYKCQLIEWCRKDFEKTGKEDLTSDGDRCRNAPWERTSPEELFQCYFGQLWYTWGLKDVVPQNE